MKTCFKCLQSKPHAEFYKHPKMKDGYLGKCKECTKQDAREHRLENIDSIRAYDRSRGVRNPDQIKQWARDHPDRRRAQVAVSNAIRDGRLSPWPACALPDCDSKPEAHHVDYGDPLGVVWLCPVHHKQAHAMCRN